MMERRIDVITLAVSDLERALAFYRDGLGLESSGVTAAEYAGDDTNPAGATVMFRLDGGLILALRLPDSGVVVPETCHYARVERNAFTLVVRGSFISRLYSGDSTATSATLPPASL